jgi:hypothetical protein
MRKLLVLLPFLAFASVDQTPTVKIDFKINNNGKISHATILTKASQMATLEESVKDPKSHFTIEALPQMTQIDVNGQQEQAISLKVKAKFMSANHEKSMNSVIVVKPGEEATFAGSENTDGKSFKISATATLVK